jgi:N-formylglutamate deformylase
MTVDRDRTVAIIGPEGERAPVVYSSPHSGRHYPSDFEPAVPVSDLIGYEDRLVDDLVADAPRLGIALVAALFPRAYVDPNRAPDDLDRHVVDESWQDPIAPTAYSERGIGLVFRKLPSGKAIYDRPLGHAALARRIDHYWRPFHRALDDALDAAVTRFGRVWHLDWHSMRPEGDADAPDPGALRPDFVVSDRDGTSAAPKVTACVVRLLTAAGHSVAVNEPFKGGFITERYGRPEAGRHTVQVEINRGLYLDMATLEPSRGFASLRATLAAVSRDLAAAARGAG